MSPTEHDLRAALRAGEGDAPNVDAIIADGRALRGRQRSQLLTSAAVTVLVAGLGVGGTLLVRSGTDGSAGQTSNAGGQLPTERSAGGASAPAPSARAPVPDTADKAARATDCPASLPRYLLPGGGSEQFGGDGPLFDKPVSSVLVCSYGATEAALSTSAPRPSRLILSGRAATALAHSLEHASTTKPSGMCSTLRSADEQALAIIGVARDGSRAGVVTTTINRPACSVTVSNGTAVRFGWTPPGDLARQLNGMDPQRGRSHGPVVGGSASPTR